MDKFKVHLNHVFGFGPISTSVNTITLHLAGPMNIKSAKYFYDKFPIFYMAFSKYNKKLSVTSFENLFIAPQYGIVELKRAIKEIIIRSKNTNSDTIKLQCLRRIKLIELIYKNRSHPYLKAYNHVKNLNHYEILMELENYEKA